MNANKKTTLRSLNNQFSVRMWPIELVKAKDYCYLIYDKGSEYKTKSIMVTRINDLSVVQWLKEAEEFKCEMEN